MPRYVIERTFPDGLTLPEGAEGAKACRQIVESKSLAPAVTPVDEVAPILVPQQPV